MEFIGIIVVVSIALVISGITMYFDKKRTEFFMKYAQNHNYSFEKENWNFISPYNFDLFNKGRNKSLKKIIKGEFDNFKFLLCDYKYQTGSGKNKSQHKQTIIIAEVEGDYRFPHFTLRPENFFDKIAGAVGFKDINFDSHPKFSKMFCLKGENEKMIRNVFTNEILSYYENNEGFITETDKNFILIYKNEKTIAAEEKALDDFINKGITIAKLFKEGRI